MEVTRISAEGVRSDTGEQLPDRENLTERHAPQEPMPDGQYVEVRTLSKELQAALRSVGCGRGDVKVKPAREIEAACGGADDGSRGFTLVLNLTTGRFHTEHGGWGGKGVGREMADFTQDRIPIPENGAVIKGTTGNRHRAVVYVNPAAFGKLLPAPSEELTDEEQNALYCYGGLSGGKYRAEEIRRRGVQAQTVLSLIERGYLKRNRAGAMSITTKGKNARDGRN